MLRTALFTTGPHWKYPWCPLTGKWMNKPWCIYPVLRVCVCVCVCARVCAELLGYVWLFVTPQTVACQVPLSMELSPRILERVTISFSRGSSRPRDWTRVSCISCPGRGTPYQWATWEAGPVQCWPRFRCHGILARAPPYGCSCIRQSWRHHKAPLGPQKLLPRRLPCLAVGRRPQLLPRRCHSWSCTRVLMTRPLTSDAEQSMRGARCGLAWLQTVLRSMLLGHCWARGS